MKPLKCCPKSHHTHIKTNCNQKKRKKERYQVLLLSRFSPCKESNEKIKYQQQQQIEKAITKVPK